LLEFASFFEAHAARPVLSFWEWDARLNLQRFDTKSKQADPKGAVQ
jgi:hypothetical protein